MSWLFNYIKWLDKLENDGKKGGRGICGHCGKWENNVSYHEAHQCPFRPNFDNSIEPIKDKMKSG